MRLDAETTCDLDLKNRGTATHAVITRALAGFWMHPLSNADAAARLGHAQHRPRRRGRSTVRGGWMELVPALLQQPAPRGLYIYHGYQGYRNS